MKLKDLKELLNNPNEDLEIEFGLLSEINKLITPEYATQIPTEGAVGNVKHSCNPGDVIAALLACKTYWDKTGRKVRFMQTLNMPAAYYAGATHETTDEKGTMVCMNNGMFNMLKPLVESQPYIHSFEPYDGQEVHVDFDTIRGKTFVNMPQGSIQGWLFYAFPDLAADISKPWIILEENKRQIEEVTKSKVLINFTERYRNNQIILDYFFLRNYAPDLMFAGTKREHFLFCNRWNLNIPRLEVSDFLELAYAIRGCRFLMSNQSLCWNLSSGIGSSRLLEVCNYAHNCMPFYGSDAKGNLNNLGYFHQVGCEHYFREMYNYTQR